MKVTITGSTGFVGQNLIPYLSKFKFEVDSLNRDELSSELKFDNTNVIIHLAGKAHDLRKTANPEEYYKVNYELTKKLYDTFLQSKAEKFIFISSVKAAADAIDGILTEDFVPKPMTDYGKSKLMAEEYIRSQPLPLGKTYYILRPCMIHGPGNKGNLNLLYQFVKRGIPYPLARFTNKRSYLSIENFCFIVKKILEYDIASGVYNLADDEALSTNDVIATLAKSSKNKGSMWFIPQKIVIFMAKIGDVLNLPLTSERLKKLTENYIVDNKKLKEALGVHLPLSSQEGIRITADSFLS